MGCRWEGAARTAHQSTQLPPENAGNPGKGVIEVLGSAINGDNGFKYSFYEPPPEPGTYVGRGPKPKQLESGGELRG